MTYKKIVVKMLEKDSKAWVEELLAKNEIRCMWAELHSLENDKDIDSFLYEVDVTITDESYLQHKVRVGGTVDDITDICHSVIWDNRHNIIWMNNPRSRENLGITSFIIGGLHGED